MTVAHKISVIFSMIRIIENWPVLITFLFKKRITKKIMLRNGFVFLTNNILDVLSIVENFSQQNQHDYFLDTKISNQANIIDVGANIGAFSIFAAINYPESKIYCFEPDYQNYQKLVKNLNLNKIKNVRTFNIAIGKKEGKIKLYSDSNGNFGTIGSSTIKVSPTSVEINCEILNDVLVENRIGTCDLLKLDCEGAEYDIIFSLNQDSIKRIKYIVLEYHHTPNYQGKDLIGCLKNQGYQVKIIPNKINKNYGFIYARK